jgi:GNAT superfamily N-acetyltransferase
MTSVMMVQAQSAPPRGVAEVTFLRPAASDTQAVLAMLGRCSRASLFHRFHGFTDGVAYFAALLRDSPANETLLAWSGSACVGVATLGVSAAGIVDLGVLVEDAWQRRGIGTRLVTSLLDSARAKGVATVHADVLVDDVFILRTLRGIGPLRVSIESGSYSIDIDLSSQPGLPSGNRLPVRLETTAGGGRRLDQQARELRRRRKAHR